MLGNRLTELVCEASQWAKEMVGLRNTFGDKVIITDEVFVYQGKRLLFKSKAHIVNQGLIWVSNLLATQGTTAAGVIWYFSSYNFAPSGNSYIRLGTGLGVTVGTMVSLVTPVATAPSSQYGATSSPTLGTYRIAWTATWNAGVLTAITVTEIGLWLAFGTHTTLQTFGWACGTVTEAAAFFSRLSSSDGDFTAFTVNTAVPLTIEWRFTVTFA